MRLDQGEYQLNGDRGIDRRAAGLQHLEADAAGDRVGGDDDAALGDDELLLVAPGGALRLLLGERDTGQGGAQQSEQKCTPDHGPLQTRARGRAPQRPIRMASMIRPMAMRYHANGVKSCRETKPMNQRTTMNAVTKAMTKPTAISPAPSKVTMARFL